MDHAHVNIADFGMDTISLAGSLPAKLAAVRNAGFSQIMLSARDVVGHADGIDAAVREVRDSGLRVTGFQVLRDFEGLSGHLHEYKMDIAKSMLEMAHALGATRAARVLVHVRARDHRSRRARARPAQARDARGAARHQGRLRRPVVGPHDQRIHRGLGHRVPRRCAQPRHGHRLVPRLRDQDSALEDLDMLDPEKIFLVQLADFMWQEVRTDEERIATARHFRVFPGEGVHSEALAELVMRLDRLGYRGDYSFEVFNDDYNQLPLPTVAARARRSAIWLSEDVLRRSVPLPNQMRLRQPA